MSEFRTDPLTGRHVIVAANRADRPQQFKRPERRVIDGNCPFCAGHEGETPEAVAYYRSRDDDQESWQLRVIPNLYPAVTPQFPESPSAPSAPPPADPRRPASFPAAGVHEVIVESPRHVVSFTQLDPSQAERTMLCYRDRLRLHAGNRSIRYAQIFKNVGPEAGASIEHTHSQLLALPLVPTEVRHQLDLCRRYFEAESRCLMCDELTCESNSNLRIVLRTANFVAYCPFASRFPYETRIAPRHHASHFEQSADRQLGELAELLRLVLIATEAQASNPSYNYVLRTAPFDTAYLEHYHWHMEVFPRLTSIAGFEIATGCFINPVFPEEAAQRLREAIDRTRSRARDSV